MDQLWWFGNYGFWAPSAMGVKFAFPEADVACVTGKKYSNVYSELSTCGQYGLPIKIINLNNRALGWLSSGKICNTEEDILVSLMKTLFQIL